MWAACGLVLLLKIGLNPRSIITGSISLCRPPCCYSRQVCWLIPALLRRWAPAGADRTFRQIAIGAIAAVALPHLMVSQRWYQAKTTLVGTGSDQFLASSAPDAWQGAAVNQAMREIQRLGGDRNTPSPCCPKA